MIRKATISLLVVLAIIFSGSVVLALEAGQTYTVEIYAIQSNGVPASQAASTATVVADGNGKISFNLSNVPNNTTANFVLIKVKDAAGNVVRQSLLPAPPQNNTNFIGVNNLTNTQTTALLQGMAAGGSDDPIYVAFGLVILRTPGLTADDIMRIGRGGSRVILGTGGFVDFLRTQGGVTAAQLATFRQKLVYNPNGVDLKGWAAQFKDAVDTGDATRMSEEMAKAGGRMADMFMDAAIAAGIDTMLIRGANEATGEVAQNDPDLSQVSQGPMAVVGQAMSAFGMRLAAMKIKADYVRALTVLNATGEQVTRFNTAVDNFVSRMQQIDAQYASYFEHPETMTTQIRTAMDTAYQNAFTQLQTDIASTNADIGNLKNKVALLLNIGVPQLPPQFGTYMDMTGTTKNWPIPQTVMVNWIADIITAGGSLVYMRDNIPVPSNMAWVGTCDDSTKFNKMTCEAAGATWTVRRHTYGAPGDSPAMASFNAYQGIQEDIQIVEFSRFAMFSGGRQPTRDEQRQAASTYSASMARIANNISGKVNASTAISAEQKQAIVKVLTQPNLN